MGRVNFLAALHPKNFLIFFYQLVQEYGIKYNLMMISTYVGVRGAFKRFLELNETAYYREAGYSVSVNQTNQALSRLPGAIMGIAGLFSDLLPFAGYEKSSYLLVYTFMGSLAVLVLAAIPFSADSHSPTLPAIFFCLGQLQSAFNDLLVEGKSIELMKDFPNNRGSLVTFQFFCVTIGSFIPSLSVGILADNLPSPRHVFWFAFPMAFQQVFFLLAGCLIRDKVAPERNNKFDYLKAKAQLPIVLTNLIMFLCAIGSFIIGLVGTTNATFLYSLGISIFLNLNAFICLPIVVAYIHLYLFLSQALYLQIQPTLEYFYLGDEMCVENGPAFDYTYLKTYVGVMSQLSQFLGLWLYQAVLTRYNYRKIFWVSISLRLFASFFDLMIVMRWNLAVGIPDRYFYLFGHAIIYEMTFMLDYLPYLLMISKICPKSIEVTLNGVLGGTFLYGINVSTYFGGFLAGLLNIQSNLEGGACNFNNIGWLVLIGNLLLPSLLVPLCFFLIPDRSVGENIADESFDNAKYLFSCINNYKITKTSPREV